MIFVLYIKDIISKNNICFVRLNAYYYYYYYYNIYIYIYIINANIYIIFDFIQLCNINISDQIVYLKKYYNL